MNTPNTPSYLQASWARSTTRRFLRWLVNWRISWRILRRMLLTGAALLTLVAVFYAVENWRGQRAWNNHRRALEAAGVKWEIAALIPPPVPDAQNLAMTPLLKPIFEYSRGTNGLQWRDTNAMERLQRIDNYRQASQKHRPTSMGNLEKGTLTDLETFRKFYLGNTNYPQATTDASAAQAVLVALSQFDAEFQELKTAAAERPLSRFPVNYLEEPPPGVLLPHLAIVKSLVRVCGLRAIARLQLGQASEALADVELGFRLADAVRDEPLLIDHLVRIATLHLILQPIREGLTRHAWNDAQLTQLEKHLAATDVLAEHQLAMNGERAFGIATLDYLRRQGWRYDPAFLFGEDPGGMRALSFQPLPGGWCYQNMLRLSQTMQDHTLAAVDPKARRVFPEKSQAGEQAVENMRTGPYTIYVKLLLPALTKATLKSARMQTFVDQTRVACALERYRLTQGRYPEALAALVPQFMEALPLDVIDGQPLRYRLTAQGEPLIYSVGWNQTDDGGKRAWTSKERSAVKADEGDWVWGPAE